MLGAWAWKGVAVVERSARMLHGDQTRWMASMMMMMMMGVFQLPARHRRDDESEREESARERHVTEAQRTSDGRQQSANTTAVK